MSTGRHEIDVAMLQSLSLASLGQGSDYVASARLALERIVAAPGLIDVAALERKAGGYARNLLFGDDVMGVWAMVWDVGASTSVHDHHCSCCFGLLSGELREMRFTAVGEDMALLAGQDVRRPGFVDCFLPSGPNLHQMVNDGAHEAVSIHIYGFDRRLEASSVRREYRVVTQ